MFKLFKNIFRKSKPQLSKEDKILLDKNVFYYHQLNDENKVLFASEVALFLAHIPIYFKDTHKNRLVCLLVASSAIIITFGTPFRYKNHITRVVITKGVVSKMENSYSTGEVRVGSNYKDLYLSEQALIQGFKNLEDKHHVGIHEFVHIIDVADGEMDGLLSFFMSEDIIEQWQKLAISEMQKIHLKKSTIRSYGATNVKEFLTVCSEYFFERPRKLEKEHPEIYRLLTHTFRQKPIQNYDFNIKKRFGKSKNNLKRNEICYCGSGIKYKKCCLTNPT